VSIFAPIRWVGRLKLRLSTAPGKPLPKAKNLIAPLPKGLKIKSCQHEIFWIFNAAFFFD